MKIISKFNDYYDGISKSFYDDEILYERKFEIIKVPIPLNKNISTNISKLINLGKNPIFYYHYTMDNIKYCKCILGYCGTLYQIYIKEVDAESILIEDSHKKSFEKLTTFYFDEINNILEFNLKLYDFLVNRIKSEITNESNNLFNLDLKDIFIELDTPIFLYVDYKSQTNENSKIIIKNPSLSYLNFTPYKTAMEVYQDVSMFISNILLNKEKSDVVISDKDLIIGKGFDYKTSFRKEKDK